MNRKDFIKNAGLAVASFTILPGHTLFPDSKVRIGMTGVGLRGQNHLNLLLRRNDVDVEAICDIDESMLGRSKNIFTKSGKKQPTVYTGDLYAWKNMLEKEQLDTVINCYTLGVA